MATTAQGPTLRTLGETYSGCALLLAVSLPLILNKVKVFLYTKTFHVTDSFF